MSVDAEALRALQAPIKAKYREAPDAAVITLKARGTIGEGITCKLETGKAIVEAGLHPATGGSGLELCSGDMLLEALVACAGVTLKAVATALGITLDSAEVFAEGDLDFRGTLGVAKDAPVGFRAIRLRFEVETEASEEQLASLLKLTERYCVVFQTINTKPQLDVVLNNAGKAA
ncbi:MAG: OsmC family protein [Beijerinckiaceae bacterium]|nr:OsmC family protein [Beijerinckiaceae bacterium]